MRPSRGLAVHQVCRAGRSRDLFSRTMHISSCSWTTTTGWTSSCRPCSTSEASWRVSRPAPTATWTWRCAQARPHVAPATPCTSTLTLPATYAQFLTSSPAADVMGVAQVASLWCSAERASGKAQHVATPIPDELEVGLYADPAQNEFMVRRFAFSMTRVVLSRTFQKF